MNPLYLLGGVVIIGGALLVATSASASEGDCEIVREYGFPYWLTGVMIRKCESEGEAIWLWDVAAIAETEFGADMLVLRWPEQSMAFGQAEDEEAANRAALAWVDANESFVQGGGQRGPLAQRTEDFLRALTPGQLDALHRVFHEADPSIRAQIERLRVAATDEAYLEVAQQIGAALDHVDQDALQSDILAAIGWGHGLTLKGILEEAGVL